MKIFGRKLKKSTKEDDERFVQAMEENNVGFKDRMAMIFSAFVVIILPCTLVLLFIVFIGMLLTGTL